MLRGQNRVADDMILYAQADGIWQVPGAGGTPEVLIPADEDETMHGPQMLPGGESVLFTARATNRSWNEAQIVVQSAATGERTVLIDGGRDGSYVSTGHLVYGLNNVLLAAPFDVDSHEITGGSVPLVEGVRAVGTGGGVHFSVSTSSSLVYIPDSAAGATRLSWVGRNGDEETIPGSTASVRASARVSRWHASGGRRHRWEQPRHLDLGSGARGADAVHL